MRPIKFRVWDKKEKVMHSPILGFGKFDYKNYPEGGFWDRDDYMNIWIEPDLDDVGDFPEKKNAGYSGTEFIFMQFTGLLDKQGEEIYEGNILFTDELLTEEQDAGHKYFKVLYSNASFVPVSELSDAVMTLDLFPGDKWKIIGNIYENKELLKNNEAKNL